MMPGDHIDEQAPLYVLSALDQAERLLVERHLTGCQRCRQLVQELRTLGDWLTQAAPEPGPPASLRARTLSRVRAERSPRPLAPTQHWWRPMAITMGLCTIVLLAGVAAVMVDQIQAERHQLRALVPSATQEARLVETVVAGRGDSVPLQATGDHQAANGRLIVDRQLGRGTLVVRQLPAAPQGMVYQVWLSREADRRPAGAFQVDDDGLAMIDMLLPNDIILYRWVWVTIEPVEGSLEPTGQMVLAASL